MGRDLKTLQPRRPSFPPFGVGAAAAAVVVALAAHRIVFRTAQSLPLRSETLRVVQPKPGHSCSPPENGSVPSLGWVRLSTGEDAADQRCIAPVASVAAVAPAPAARSFDRSSIRRREATTLFFDVSVVSVRKMSSTTPTTPPLRPSSLRVSIWGVGVVSVHTS